MATQNYDSFVNNDQNPFVEHIRRETEGSNPVKGRESQSLLGGLPDGGRIKAVPLVEDSENDEGAPNSGFVIHVATEPGKGKAAALKFIWGLRSIRPLFISTNKRALKLCVWL